MQGAREYAKMFTSQQVGRLYLVSGSHARGLTFHIWVMPTDAIIKGMPWSCKDAVEVYGVIYGNPGWTEAYGWLYRGPWVEDFAKLVAAKNSEIALARQATQRAVEDAALAEKQRIAALLATY